MPTFPTNAGGEAAGNKLAASPLERVLDRLERVKRAGSGYVARCPAHEDRNPSLSVSEGRDGRVLLRCHAGCSAEAIVAALGLALSELFPRNPCKSGGVHGALDTPATNGRGRIVASYDYVDEEGTLLYQAVRFDPKRFAQRAPAGSGWTWSLNGVRRVLYRLPAVLEASRASGTVYVVEGEKDVHALERLGLVATCNAAGAGKWREEYADALRGAGRVVIVPDRKSVV